MCLSLSMPLEQVKGVIPKEPFYVYKLLSKRGNELVSPHYSHKKWTAGTMIASGQSRNNGDSGIYAFFTQPSEHVVLTNGSSGNRLIRMTVDPADVVAGGPDSWNGNKGFCVVARKVTITQEDFDLAMNDQHHEFAVNKLCAEGQKTVEEAREKVTKKKAAVKKTITEAKEKKKATKKAEKKVAKKAEKEVKKETKAAKKTITTAKEKAAAKKRNETLTMMKGMDLSKATVSYLKAFATDLGVKGASKMNKDKLIDALKAEILK